MDWNQVPLWLVTSFIGAGIVKLLDLWGLKYRKIKDLQSEKVQTIVEHIDEYGELTQLYRFMAYVYSGIPEDERGELQKDEEGKYIVEKQVLVPEPGFEEAIKSLTGSDINTAISEKIAAIRLKSSEVVDLSLEIDPSGSIRDGFNDLYVSTVLGIDSVLKYRELGDPAGKFKEMISSLEVADETRRQVRASVNKYY